MTPDELDGLCSRSRRLGFDTASLEARKACLDADAPIGVLVALRQRLDAKRMAEFGNDNTTGRAADRLAEDIANA